MARRKNRFCDIVLYGVCLFICVVCFSTSHAAGIKTDVRIVMPISHTLDQLDNEKQRIDVLKSWVELAVDGNKMGVWTYGKYVNMLVPHRVVDANWKQQAFKQLDNLKSVATLHNLGAALEKATYNSTPQDNTRIHVVIITDGGIALDNPEQSKAYHDRVLTQMLPSWINDGIIIHAIALGDAADETLLLTLSEKTGGNFYRLSNLDNLIETAFLFANTHFFYNPFFEVSTQAFAVNENLSSMQIMLLGQLPILNQDRSPQSLVKGPASVGDQSDGLSISLPPLYSKHFALFRVEKPQLGSWSIEQQNVRYFVQFSDQALSSAFVAPKVQHMKVNPLLVQERGTIKSEISNKTITRPVPDRQSGSIRVEQVSTQHVVSKELINNLETEASHPVNIETSELSVDRVPAYHAELKQILPSVNEAGASTESTNDVFDSLSMSYKLLRLVEIFDELPIYVKIWLILLVVSCIILVGLLAWPLFHKTRRQQTLCALST